MLLNSQTSLRLKDSRIYELHKAMDGTQIGLDSHSDGEGVVLLIRSTYSNHIVQLSDLEL